MATGRRGKGAKSVMEKEKFVTREQQLCASHRNLAAGRLMVTGVSGTKLCMKPSLFMASFRHRRLTHSLSRSTFMAVGCLSV